MKWRRHSILHAVKICVTQFCDLTVEIDRPS